MPSGGPRDGSGRPRAVATVLRDRKVVERRLKLAAEEGWEVLADSYVSLMRAAIDVALGKPGDGPPNIMMLKTLVELMLKVVGSEPDQADSVIKQLVERFLARTQEPNGDKPAVDGDGPGRPPDPYGRYDLRPQGNTTLPGVGDGISILGAD